MGVLESIYEVLAANEAKRKRIQNIIGLLMLEWKDFDSHMELAQKCLQEGLDEMQSRESHLCSLQESVSKSSEETKAIRKSVEERLKRLVDKEKESNLDLENWTREVKLKQETFSLIREEFELKEERLNEHEKLVQVLFEKIEVEQKQLEVVRELVGERFSEIELKDNQMKRRVNELNLQEQKVRQREKEVELREKMLNTKRKEIELREGEIYSSKLSRKRSLVPDFGATPGTENFHMPRYDAPPGGSREVKNKHRKIWSADEIISSAKSFNEEVESILEETTRLLTEVRASNATMRFQESAHEEEICAGNIEETDIVGTIPPMSDDPSPESDKDIIDALGFSFDDVFCNTH